MSEKLLAGLTAAVVIAPLCVLCVLGPAVIASMATGITAWLGGFDPVSTLTPAFVAGMAVFAIVRQQRVLRTPLNQLER